MAKKSQSPLFAPTAVRFEVSNQLRTSSEPANVMEFGLYRHAGRNTSNRYWGKPKNIKTVKRGINKKIKNVFLRLWCRGDVQRAAVADAVGVGGEYVGLSRTSASCQLWGYVLSSEVPDARRHVQQPPQHDARRITLTTVEAAAAAIREQLQLSCRSVLPVSI